MSESMAIFSSEKKYIQENGGIKVSVSFKYVISQSNVKMSCMRKGHLVHELQRFSFDY